MAEFGVSQAPVREALRELEAARFLEGVPHRGVHVREVTPAELDDMYPVRTVLEELAGQLAAPLVTADTVSALEAELRAMRVAAERRDVPQQVLHDVRFHKIIIEAAGNALLTRAWSTMHFEVLTMVTFRLATDDLRAMAEAHRPIVAALRARDPVRTGAELREHFRYARSLSGLGVPDARSDDPAGRHP
jgi:DNA-binding GntR family transcriptional regulator